MSKLLKITAIVVIVVAWVFTLCMAIQVIPNDDVAIATALLMVLSTPIITLYLSAWLFPDCKIWEMLNK
jgi:hypothetical protein